MNRENAEPLFLPIVSLSTVVSLAVSLYAGVRHGVRAGFLLFGECLLGAFLWVFLFGMLSVVCERFETLKNLENWEGRPFRIALGVLSVVKNVGLVLGPLALLLLAK